MSDRRERNHKWYESFDEKRMMASLDMPGLLDTIEVPVRYEVCGTCDGKGHHVNPSIDSNGLSREDFDEDPGFAEDYFSGMYDVTCSECHGNRVSPVLDEERMTPEMLALVHDFIDEFYENQRIEEAERRMGF